ncbi:MAG: sulfotransferase family protein [Pikeienuella sp.]
MDFDKTCVLVAGMHRSGTSAVTRALNIMGCDLSGDLVEPLENSNPKGFWEAKQAVEISREALGATGQFWNDWRPLGPVMEDPAFRAPLVARIREMLEAEYAQSRLFAIKDPRVCRFLPIWLEALEGFGARPVVVLPLRHPAEVAASIVARDGMVDSECRLSWLRHVLDAERDSRAAAARVFTSYEALLQDPAALLARISGALDIAWPRDPAEAAPGLAAFIDSGERHHRFTPDPEKEPGPVEETYELLLRWCHDDIREGDQQRLDALRAGFDDGLRLFGTALLEARALRDGQHQAIRHARGLEARRDELIEQLKTRKAEAEQAWRNVKALTARREEMERKFSDRQKAYETRAAIAAAELARLTILLRKEETARDRIEGRYAAAAGFIARALAVGRRGGIAGFLARLWPWRRAGGARRLGDLRASGVFDEAWYRETYPDIAGAGADPAAHFLEFGHAEGRAPNEVARARFKLYGG